MSKRKLTAKTLDRMGITVTSAIDPGDGSQIPVVHLDDLAPLADLITRVQGFAVRGNETEWGSELAAILDDGGAWT